MYLIKRLLKDRRGAAAIEFAVVSSLLILTILFIMVVATVLYINQALDYATSRAARQLMTGMVQNASTSQSDFQTKILCGYLPSGFPCNNLIVNLYTVTQGGSPSSYYSFVKSDTSGLLIPALTNSSSQYQVGSRGVYQYLLVIYPITFIPSAFASILGAGATYNGAPAYLAVSTAAFRNEQF